MTDAGDRHAAAFTVFVADAEPRLRRALSASYGADLGADATAEALAWAWAHHERLATMANPVGYLFRVGQTSAHRLLRQTRHELHVAIPTAPTSTAPAFEPGLRAALNQLSPRQRAAVLLVHGFGYSFAETAEVLGIGVRTVRNHTDRALRHLRDHLGVHDAL